MDVKGKNLKAQPSTLKTVALKMFETPLFLAKKKVNKSPYGFVRGIFRNLRIQVWPGRSAPPAVGG